MVANARRIHGVTAVHADMGTPLLRIDFDPLVTSEATIIAEVVAILDRLEH